MFCDVREGFAHDVVRGSFDAFGPSRRGRDSEVEHDIEAGGIGEIPDGGVEPVVLQDRGQDSLDRVSECGDCVPGLHVGLRCQLFRAGVVMVEAEAEKTEHQGEIDEFLLHPIVQVSLDSLPFVIEGIDENGAGSVEGLNALLEFLLTCVEQDARHSQLNEHERRIQQHAHDGGDDLQHKEKPAAPTHLLVAVDERNSEQTDSERDLNRQQDRKPDSECESHDEVRALPPGCRILHPFPPTAAGGWLCTAEIVPADEGVPIALDRGEWSGNEGEQQQPKNHDWHAYSGDQNGREKAAGLCAAATVGLLASTIGNSVEIITLNTIFACILGAGAITSAAPVILPPVIAFWPRLVPDRFSISWFLARTNALERLSYSSSCVTPLLVGVTLIGSIYSAAYTQRNAMLASGIPVDQMELANDQVIIMLGGPLILAACGAATSVFQGTEHRQNAARVFSRMGLTRISLLISALLEAVIYVVTAVLIALVIIGVIVAIEALALRDAVGSSLPTITLRPILAVATLGLVVVAAGAVLPLTRTRL